MNQKLYRHLAVSNLQRNRFMLLPYYISCVLVIALHYVVNALVETPGLKNISGGNFTADVMKLGCWLFGVMAILFLFYTNSFIMKRRKKELGLYHILGLEKRHIYKVMGYESLISLSTVILEGLLLGTLLNPLLFLLLSKIIGQKTVFSGAVSTIVLLKTGLLFLFLFFVIHRYNIRHVHRTNPIDLLHASSQGEKEPKANIILVILGTVILAAGYFLAITLTEPKNDADFTKMIAAVLCVSMATYLLFIAVSIAVLKFLKNREDIYYRSKYFTLISGMLYRMKQNGVGLANICILCTAALFVMTTTLSLYLGIGNVIENSYPHDVYLSEEGGDHKAIMAYLEDSKSRYSVDMEDMIYYTGAKFKADLNLDGTKEYFFLMPLESYNQLTGQKEELTENEAIVFAEKHKVGNVLSMNGIEVNVKETPKSFPLRNNFDHIFGNTWWYVVVDETSAFAQNFDLLKNAGTYTEFNIIGDKSSKREFSYALGAWAENHQISSELRIIQHDSLIVHFGGLLFLGMLVSIVLFLQTALCVFYKQVSEGYDDRQRFDVFSKVGMSQKEIRQKIRRQTLIVFFSPLAVAVLHMFIALPMISKLLKIAFLDSTIVAALSSLCCMVVFLIVYGLVFMLTEGAYRRIVRLQHQ